MSRVAYAALGKRGSFSRDTRYTAPPADACSYRQHAVPSTIPVAPAKAAATFASSPALTVVPSRSCPRAAAREA